MVSRSTNRLKWVKVGDNYIDGERPLAQIAGYPENGPTWYCLKQYWLTEKGGEWRDIEVEGL